MWNFSSYYARRHAFQGHFEEDNQVAWIGNNEFMAVRAFPKPDGRLKVIQRRLMLRSTLDLIIKQFLDSNYLMIENIISILLLIFVVI